VKKKYKLINYLILKRTIKYKNILSDITNNVKNIG